MADEERDAAPGPGAGTESAPPDAPGPGAGVAGAATQLTGAAQDAANRAIDALQDLSNHVFDAGEAGLGDALKVVDAAQTQVSNLLSQITEKIANKVGPN